MVIGRPHDPPYHPLLMSTDTFTPPLARDFYDRDVTTVARGLLGMGLFRRTRAGVTIGRIVEVEAYLAAGDPACHAARGKTRKNASMFGLPGRAYVYAIHSRWCLNAVTEPRGTPSAVLIRAVEPLTGQSLMASRRGTDRERDLARGPGRLCEAMDINRSLDGWNLAAGRRLWIAPLSSEPPAEPIVSTTRVGVTSAHDLPLRFLIAGSAFVSKPPRDAARTARVRVSRRPPPAKVRA